MLSTKTKSLLTAALLAAAAIGVSAVLTSCGQEPLSQPEYAVLLGEESDHADRLPAPETLVIDGAYFSADDVADLKARGVQKIYSYLNIGSLEDFRDYYDEFYPLTLGDYEDWPEERWIDVSVESWQDLCIQLGADLKAKGFDGFFIDNTDVYYHYPTEEIYSGLVEILSVLRGMGMDIWINGGDEFVSRYIGSGAQERIFDGVNQENVYTMYDFDRNRCLRNTPDEQQYLEEYLAVVADAGYGIFTLEYADDPQIMADARTYDLEQGWTCYVSDNIELKLNKR